MESIERKHESDSATGQSKGKAVVWVEAEVQYFVDCCVAEQRGEELPAGPSKSAPVRLIRFPEVERMTGLKRGHTSWLIQQGRFPAPLKLPAANPGRNVSRG